MTSARLVRRRRGGHHHGPQRFEQWAQFAPSGRPFFLLNVGNFIWLIGAETHPFWAPATLDGLHSATFHSCPGLLAGGSCRSVGGGGGANGSSARARRQRPHLGGRHVRTMMVCAIVVVVAKVVVVVASSAGAGWPIRARRSISGRHIGQVGLAGAATATAAAMIIIARRPQVTPTPASFPISSGKATPTRWQLS